MPLADRARRIGRPSYPGLNTKAAAGRAAYGAAYGEGGANGEGALDAAGQSAPVWSSL